MNLMLAGGLLCPYYLSSYPGSSPVDTLWYFGIKIFLVVWVIFVPIVITARLDRIIKLLQEKK